MMELQTSPVFENELDPLTDDEFEGLEKDILAAGSPMTRCAFGMAC